MLAEAAETQLGGAPRMTPLCSHVIDSSDWEYMSLSACVLMYDLHTSAIKRILISQ